MAVFILKAIKEYYRLVDGQMSMKFIYLSTNIVNKTVIGG